MKVQNHAFGFMVLFVALLARSPELPAASLLGGSLTTPMTVATSDLEGRSRDEQHGGDNWLDVRLFDIRDAREIWQQKYSALEGRWSDWKYLATFPGTDGSLAAASLDAQDIAYLPTSYALAAPANPWLPGAHEVSLLSAIEPYFDWIEIRGPGSLAVSAPLILAEQDRVNPTDLNDFRSLVDEFWPKVAASDNEADALYVLGTDAPGHHDLIPRGNDTGPRRAATRVELAQRRREPGWAAPRYTPLPPSAPVVPKWLWQIRDFGVPAGSQPGIDVQVLLGSGGATVRPISQSSDDLTFLDPTLVGAVAVSRTLPDQGHSKLTEVSLFKYGDALTESVHWEVLGEVVDPDGEGQTSITHLRAPVIVDYRHPNGGSPPSSSRRFRVFVVALVTDHSNPGKPQREWRVYSREQVGARRWVDDGGRQRWENHGAPPWGASPPEQKICDEELVPCGFNLTTAVAWRDFDERAPARRIEADAVAVFGQTDDGRTAVRLEYDKLTDRWGWATPEPVGGEVPPKEVSGDAWFTASSSLAATRLFSFGSEGVRASAFYRGIWSGRILEWVTSSGSGGWRWEVRR